MPYDSERQRRYYARNRMRLCAKNRVWRAANKVKTSASNRAANVALKIDVMMHYGGAKCRCCGETLFEGLTIDHLDGGAGHHRTHAARNTSGLALYRRLKNDGYPSGFQVLCGTCNLAKGASDHCPHEDAIIAWG